ncbi:DUF58 domain-containing protein [Halioxenophilus sp. WMMB6]|uniref:DUF58 domain-containing protein n=1 Tax=Halioxenophilus sp. WMMB6 TaxID=3073815 RepID=UPI00295E2CDF|nr:DUF58 domain-containing protein [Halioxenophilus sp. WMMB6]
MKRQAAEVKSLSSRTGVSGVHAELEELLLTRLTASQLNLQYAKPSRSLLAGPIHTRTKGRGMEFEEVRVYHPGDDIRSIDWRVTARTQVTHTKLFQEEREKPVLVVVDQRSNMFFGSQRCFKSVYAAHLAAAIGWAAIGQNDRIGALLFADDTQQDVRPKRSKHAQLALLQKLVEFNQRLHSPLPSGRKISMEEMLADVRRVAKPGTNIFILSDFSDLNPECEKQLYLLARHNDVSLFHIFDTLEQQLPNTAQLSVSNGHQRLQLNPQELGFQQRYQNLFDSRLARLQQIANSFAVNVVNACTTEDPERLLLGLYGKAKRSNRFKSAARANHQSSR